MARPRVINPDSILDAAEEVVIRDGATHLTLEAVAAVAKVSKASVLYDYKTKNALIKAIVERKIAVEQAIIDTAIAGIGDRADSVIRGRIAAAAETITEETHKHAVALNLCSALAQDEDLRAVLQETFRDAVKETMENASQPRKALMAFLALEGLRSLQMFGLHTWTKAENLVILKEIEDLIELS